MICEHNGLIVSCYGEYLSGTVVNGTVLNNIFANKASFFTPPLLPPYGDFLHIVMQIFQGFVFHAGADHPLINIA